MAKSLSELLDWFAFDYITHFRVLVYFPAASDLSSELFDLIGQNYFELVTIVLSLGLCVSRKDVFRRLKSFVFKFIHIDLDIIFWKWASSFLSIIAVIISFDILRTHEFILWSCIIRRHRLLSRHLTFVISLYLIFYFFVHFCLIFFHKHLVWRIAFYFYLWRS